MREYISTGEVCDFLPFRGAAVGHCNLGFKLHRPRSFPRSKARRMDGRTRPGQYRTMDGQARTMGHRRTNRTGRAQVITSVDGQWADRTLNGSDRQG